MIKIECPCCGVLFAQEQAKSYYVDDRLHPKVRAWRTSKEDKEEDIAKGAESAPLIL